MRGGTYYDESGQDLILLRDTSWSNISSIAVIIFVAGIYYFVYIY